MTLADAPDVIVRYLSLAPKADVDAVVECFTPDAEVIDDGKTYQGHDGIRQWRETVASKFTYTIEPVSSQEVDDNGFVVTARLEGTFPGSPVDLKFGFVLRDGLIAALEIAP